MEEQQQQQQQQQQEPPDGKEEAAAPAAAASGRSLGPGQAAAAAAGAAAGEAPRVKGSGPQLDMMTGRHGWLLRCLRVWGGGNGRCGGVMLQRRLNVVVGVYDLNWSQKVLGGAGSSCCGGCSCWPGPPGRWGAGGSAIQPCTCGGRRQLPPRIQLTWHATPMPSPELSSSWLVIPLRNFLMFPQVGT